MRQPITPARLNATRFRAVPCILRDSGFPMMAAVVLAALFAVTSVWAQAPSISVQPRSGPALTGSSLNFEVTASGAAPLYFQWRKQGTNLDGQTNATLLLPSLSATDTAAYTVVVSNAAGSVTSAPAWLRVTDPATAYTTPFRSGHLAEGLVGWWKLDEVSGTRADSSGKGNHLTDNNAVGSVVEDYWGTGERSADFESGSPQYFSISNAAQTGLDLHGDSFTLAGWVKCESYAGGNMAVMNKGDWAPTSGYLWRIEDVGRNQLIINGINFYGLTGSIPLNKWVHLAIVRNLSSNTVEFYTDGNLESVTSTAVAMNATAKDFRLGQYVDTDGAFDGLMKDMAVWDVALTPLQIKSLALGLDLEALSFRPGNVTDGLVSWWKLNEISNESGDVMRMDSGPSGNHLTDVLTVPGDVGGFLEGVSARFTGTPHGSAMGHLKRMSGNVSPSLKLDGAEQGITISTWIYPTVIDSTDAVLALYGSNYVGLTVHAANSVSVNLSRGGASVGLTTPTNSIILNHWNHITAVYDPVADEARIYVDGTLRAATAYGGGLRTVDANLFVGSNGDVAGADYMTGRLSDLAVWNRALTTNEIKALATGLPLQQSGIVSYWPLDEAGGTRTDRIGGNHLTSSNGVGNGTGLVGGAADFEQSSNQFLKITSAAQSGLNITSGLTLLGWVKPETVGTIQVFASRGVNDLGYHLSYRASGIGQFGTGSGAGSSSSSVSGGTNWFFLGGVWDEAARKVYFNGVLEQNSAGTPPSSNSSPFTLGANDSPAEFTDGLLDEVLVAKRAFRDEEIKALYNRGLNGRPALLVSPAITTQPQSLVVSSGTNALVTVEATGADRLNYQWRFNGTTLANATNATLTITNAQFANAGGYSVVVSNYLGVVTSAVAQVTVATRIWTGNGDGQSWADPGNWSDNTVPTAADDIFIGDGVGTMTNLPNGLILKNLLCRRSLALTGSLTVTGSVNIVGTLYLSPLNTIAATGSNAVLLVDGPVVGAVAVNFYAQQGGTISLPGLTQLSGGANMGTITVQAADLGSLLDLSAVGRIEGGTGGGANHLQVWADDGGFVNLGGLTNVAHGQIYMQAIGTNSLLDASALQKFTGPGEFDAYDGGTVLAGQLTNTIGVGALIISGGQLIVSNLVHVSGGASMGTVSWRAQNPGTVLNLSSIRQIEGATGGGPNYLQVVAENGALVNLDSFTNAPRGALYLQAQGTNSLLNVPVLREFIGPGSLTAYDSGTVQAAQLTNTIGVGALVTSGGTLIVTNLVHISGGTGMGTVSWRALNPGTVLNLSSIRQIEGVTDGGPNYLQVVAEDGALVNLESFTNAPRGRLYLQSQGTNSLLNMPVLREFTGPGDFSAYDGGTVLAGQLTNTIGVGALVITGGKLIVSNLAHIAGGLNMGAVIWEVRDPGSVLDLSSVLRMEGGAGGGQNFLRAKALNGAFLDLGGLTNIAHGLVYFDADGASSIIDATSLQAFIGPGDMAQDNGGRILRGTNVVYQNVSFALAPFILAAPENLIVFAGSNATFSPQVDGTAPLSYQWFFNQTTPLPGATNAVLSFPAGYHSAGSYGVIVGNAFGFATSAVATLQVAPPLTVAVQGRGTVAKLPDAPGYSFGQAVLLTATAGRYYAFQRWSDGVTNNPRPVTISTSNNYYLARFTNTVPLDLRILPEWEQTFGGSADDAGTIVKQTADGGYIVGGWSQSTNSGTHNLDNYGDADWWLLKLAAGGNKVFERSFGAAGSDSLNNILETSDGYVLLGPAAAGTSLGKTNAGFGGSDWWLVKVDLAGQKVWERVYGGSQEDQALALARAPDGGFVLGGSSASAGGSGNRTAPNLGGQDAWLVRTDAEGNKSGVDVVARKGNSSIAAILPLVDGGYRLLGYTERDDAGNYVGSVDLWNARTDALGVVQTNVVYGGSGYDVIPTQGARALLNGGAIISGDSSSAPISGGRDVWVLATDPNGVEGEQVKFGTPGSDSGIIEPNRFGGYLLAVNYATSGGTRIAPEHGASDVALIKLTTNLVRTLEVSFGGTNSDVFNDLRQTADGGFVAVGHTSSPQGSGTRQTPNYGGSDVWVMKFSEVETPVGTPIVLVNGFYSPSNSFTFAVTNTISITLTSTYPGGYVFYTLDGSEPDPNFPATSFLYDGTPFSLAETRVVRVVAYTSNGDFPQECDPVTVNVLPQFSVANTTPGGGYVLFDPPSGPYLQGTRVQLTAIPSNGWVFMRWEGSASGTNASYELTVDEAKSVKAVFGTSVGTNLPSGGGIVLSPPSGPYPYGLPVRLTGAPLPGKYFTRWFNNVIGPTVNPLSFTVTSPNTNITAFFGNLPANNFTLTVLLEGPGTVTRSPSSGFYTNGTNVILTAQADAGFVFTNWSGDASGTSTQINITMNSHKVITASFGTTGPPPNQPPSVALLTPAHGTLFSTPANIPLSASADDADGAVVGVSFYHGGTLIASVASAPYQFTWSNVPPAVYALTARALDSGGAWATSAVATVTVSNSPPAVFLPPPANGAAFVAPTNITLVAYAADSDGVSEVRFFHGGTNLIGATTNQAADYYSLVWSNVPAGNYEVIAEAQDHLGATNMSPPHSLTVLPAGFTGQGFHFTQLNYSTNESGGTITVYVEHEPGGPADVDFATANGSATAAKPDYLPVGGSLVFTGATEIKPIVIPIVDNSSLDGTREFHVRLSLPGGASFAQATVTILDDDGQNNASYLGFRLPTTVNPASQLQIFLQPTNAGWRLPWESAWRGSGGTIAGLLGGQYDVAYKPVPGFDMPTEATNLSIAVPDNTVVTRAVAYTPSGFPASGALTVVIEPPELTNGLWVLAGEPGAYPSGVTTNTAPGTYVVVALAAAGWDAPGAVPVTVVEGEERIITLRYTLAEAWTGNPLLQSPQMLRTFANIQSVLNGDDHLPFGWNGQISSDLGSGSGVVVKDRVVLTAAHVVWDEARQRIAPNLRWFFQRHAGDFEPKPLVPRGVLLLTNYVTVRSNYLAGGGQSGVSTPASRREDIAVLYFDQPAGRGGYGGYLLSETETNVWLLGTRNKMLVGYPTSGNAVQPGKIHETLSGNYAFLSDGGGTYRTVDLRGFPGNSGGPLYVSVQVQVTNAIFYPAAVYLGSAGAQSYVRAIDTNVVWLINLAAALAVSDEATNQLDPAFLNIVLSTNSSASLNRRLYVTINPPEATNSGARWSVFDIHNNRFLITNQVSTNLGANVSASNSYSYRVDFAPAAGFVAPSSYFLVVTGAYDVRVTANYLRPPQFLTQPQSLRLFPGESATFSAVVTGTPPVFLQWSHNGIPVGGATSSVLLLPIVAAGDAGSYVLVATNLAATASTLPAVLTVFSALPRLEVSRGGGLSLLAPTGRTYQVQRSDRPHSNWSNWLDVHSLLMATNLAPATAFTNGPGQFYRVRVVP